MTRPETHSDHAPAVLPTAREPGHSAHPLGRHLPTERTDGTALPRRAAVPDATFRSPRTKADGRAAGYPAVVTVRHGNRFIR